MKRRDLKSKDELRVYIKILYSKYFIIFSMMIIIYMGFQVWEVYYKFLETKKKLNNSNEVLYSAQLKENDLMKDIESLESEFGIEKEIRETYGMVKEGEELVRIIDNKENLNLSDTKKDESFWGKIKDMF